LNEPKKSNLFIISNGGSMWLDIGGTT